MAVEAGEDGAGRYGVLVGLVPALSVTQPGGVTLALPVEDGIQPGGEEGEKPVMDIRRELDARYGNMTTFHSGHSMHCSHWSRIFLFHPNFAATTSVRKRLEVQALTSSRGR